MAFKVFNDVPVQNRLFAYFANIDTKDFNKLEIELAKKLNFDTLIPNEIFTKYKSELELFAVSQRDILEQHMLNYKHDKAVIKGIKNKYVHNLASYTLF